MPLELFEITNELSAIADKVIRKAALSENPLPDLRRISFMFLY